jgi:hypothetical protein
MSYYIVQKDGTGKNTFLMPTRSIDTEGKGNIEFTFTDNVKKARVLLSAQDAHTGIAALAKRGFTNIYIQERRPPKPPKHKTNVEQVEHLMNFSNFGALKQAFVMQALKSYATDMIAPDMAWPENAIVSKDTWVGIAKELLNDLDNFKKEN